MCWCRNQTPQTQQCWGRTRVWAGSGSNLVRSHNRRTDRDRCRRQHRPGTNIGATPNATHDTGEAPRTTPLPVPGQVRDRPRPAPALLVGPTPKPIQRQRPRCNPIQHRNQHRSVGRRVGSVFVGVGVGAGWGSGRGRVGPKLTPRLEIGVGSGRGRVRRQGAQSGLMQPPEPIATDAQAEV